MSSDPHHLGSNFDSFDVLPSKFGNENICAVDFSFGSEDDATKLPQAEWLEFQGAFYRELARLQEWAASHRWSVSSLSRISVVVSDQFRISRSLVPGWYGRPGYMEVPMWRVASRNAAIMHELVHIFFPNGNRLLAEGLAIFLQDSIGNNPAFPNFGEPLHSVVAKICVQNGLITLSQSPPVLTGLDLLQLDQIETPSPLTLRVRNKFFGEDRDGQAFVYPIAGSFVKFLVESRGLKKFHDLYKHSPLIPHVRGGNSQTRWGELYGNTLKELESEWKLVIVNLIQCSNAEPKKKEFTYA